MGDWSFCGKDIPKNEIVFFSQIIAIYFTSCYTLSFVYKLLYVVICLQVVTRVYNVLQVHVSPSSEVTFGNDVIHLNTTSSTSAKSGWKMQLYTTAIVL